jgi:hypothetical protein
MKRRQKEPQILRLGRASFGVPSLRMTIQEEDTVIGTTEVVP